MNLRFLGLEEVISLHVEQVERYGGIEGIRDLGLLESAVAVAEASFGGAYLHATLPEMAAAYLFHLAQNHPFVDGNKRVAAAAMFMFLFLNDLVLSCSEDELVELTLGVASGETTKAEVAVFVASHCRSPGDS
ncbi:MAG: type II toxin-antitoxin system death-on-curing family toxin [Kofleriaceae bacterium]